MDDIIKIFDSEYNYIGYNEGITNKSSTKIIFKDLKSRINWLLINNKIDFYKLNRLEQECLIILQPYIDIFELNWVIYDNEYMEKYWNSVNNKENRCKYAVRIASPDELNKKIENYINKLYGKNTISIETNVKAMKTSYKESDILDYTIIFDRGNRWIRYNGISDGTRIKEDELL